ncbi:MAG TPA: FIST N-terminal domain-containing protein [Acidimicrobiales bacterium]
MTFGASLSEHPVAAHAVGDAVGQLLEQVGEEPDLAVLFVTADHTGALEDIVHAVAEILRPRVFVGATANAVVGGGHGVEDTPGLSLFAARLPGRVTPVRLTAVRAGDGWAVEGLDHEAMATARSLLLLVDPFTFPVDGLLADLRTTHPNLGVVGGLASAARGPGGNRLVLDGTLHTHGAVGVLLDDAIAPDVVVSQGCRPIGEPFIVTRAERSIIFELGGRPALERLIEIIDGLAPDERALAARGLHCGVVVNEYKATFERGDFLIRGVLGADRDAQAIAVGDEVPVGATIQFQVRDAETAGEDLIGLLSGHDADAALMFTCNGRGAAMFGDADHDPAILQDALGPLPAAGMFCAGELGPVGGRNVLHGFTASILLFSERSDRRPETAL